MPSRLVRRTTAGVARVAAACVELVCAWWFAYAARRRARRLRVGALAFLTETRHIRASLATDVAADCAWRSQRWAASPAENWRVMSQLSSWPVCDPTRPTDCASRATTSSYARASPAGAPLNVSTGRPSGSTPDAPPCQQHARTTAAAPATSSPIRSPSVSAATTIAPIGTRLE